MFLRSHWFLSFRSNTSSISSSITRSGMLSSTFTPARKEIALFLDQEHKLTYKSFTCTSYLIHSRHHVKLDTFYPIRTCSLHHDHRTRMWKLKVNEMSRSTRTNGWNGHVPHGTCKLWTHVIKHTLFSCAVIRKRIRVWSWLFSTDVTSCCVSAVWLPAMQMITVNTWRCITEHKHTHLSGFISSSSDEYGNAIKLI